jgi:prolyl oligopeptidase
LGPFRCYQFDGRFAVVTTAIGTDYRFQIGVIDLTKRKQNGWHITSLVTGFDHSWKFIDSIGHTLWFLTNWRAPRYRIVTIDLEQSDAQWQEVLAEGEGARTCQHCGDRLIVAMLKDAATRALILT